MLTKKEYLTHLSYGVDTCPAIYDAFEELIENYFKLLETYNKLEKSSYSLECQLHEIYYPNAYKFEDLKVEMWVWYETNKECKKIREISDSDEKFKWVKFDGGYVVEFIENRFFPITKAMFLQEKNKIELFK